MTEAGMAKKTRLSVFSKEKPRAIYRYSDELPEEPPAKVLSRTPPWVGLSGQAGQAGPGGAPQTLQGRLQQIQQAWQAPASLEEFTAQYQPLAAGGLQASRGQGDEGRTPAVEAQDSQGGQAVGGQAVGGRLEDGKAEDSRLEAPQAPQAPQVPQAPQAHRADSPKDAPRQQSFGRTTQNMPNLEADRTVEPFRRHSLQENAAEEPNTAQEGGGSAQQRPFYFSSAQAPQLAAQPAVQPFSTAAQGEQYAHQLAAARAASGAPALLAMAQMQGNSAALQKEQVTATQEANYTQQPQPQPVQMPAKQPEMRRSQVFLVNGIKYIGLRELGKGGSASVYQAMTSDLQQCALKVIQLREENDELCGKNAIMREIGILERLKGLSITLDILQYQFTPKEAFIVLQLGDIDLKTFLKENPILSTIRILSLFEDMVEKTMIMHKAGFIHGDIKPHNFMFYHAKLMIIDFGISKQMQNQTTVFRDSLSGTPKYMAPEVIASQYREPGARIHRASDVWSLGCILFEMACNESPFEAILKSAKNPLVFIDILRRKEFEINFSKIENAFIRSLAKQMLEANDETRIPLDQVLYELRQE